MKEDAIISILTIVAVVALASGIGLLLAFPVKWTWNATMPYLFDLKELTWGKAWCLYFLCHALIRSSSSSSNKN